MYLIFYKFLYIYNKGKSIIIIFLFYFEFKILYNFHFLNYIYKKKIQWMIMINKKRFYFRFDVGQFRR
jgi:hypothetical protein